MKDRFAVLDLGSNTFHLLIVEAHDSGFNEVYRNRTYTKLGMGGSERILDESYVAGINCLLQFKKQMSAHNVTHYKAIGTAALRTSSNGAAFLAEAKEKTGIHIELIDGKTEASYIASGVVQATAINKGHQWIMDIGGGSVEFILLADGKAIWMESYKIGLGILKARFHNNDPITAHELTSLNTFLETELTTVINKSIEHKVNTLIGASGSFEVVQHMLKLKSWNSGSYRCHALDFYKVKEYILTLDSAERLNVEGLPIERVDLIVVALKLMDYIMTKCTIEQLIISDYALKEGVIREHYKNI